MIRIPLGAFLSVLMVVIWYDSGRNRATSMGSNNDGHPAVTDFDEPARFSDISKMVLSIVKFGGS